MGRFDYATCALNVLHRTQKKINEERRDDIMVDIIYCLVEAFPILDVGSGTVGPVKTCRPMPIAYLQ